MSEQPAGAPAPAGAGARLLALYDHALPQVYGYLLARCGQRAVAEDLTAETFLAAVDAVRAGPAAPCMPPRRCWCGRGRHATEPRQEPYGLTADCTDDQGTRFYLGQFPAG